MRRRSAANVANILSRIVDILEDLLYCPDTESFFLPKHITESAFIMGAANGRLYQKTVGLYPGSIYFSFVIHNFLLKVLLS